ARRAAPVRRDVARDAADLRADLAGAARRFQRDALSPTASAARVPSTPPGKDGASACLRPEHQPRMDCWTLAQGSALERVMRTSAHLLAATAALCLTATGSSAMPMSAGALNPALDATNLVEQSAVFVFEGRPYCFYFDGWHGPGWYRCGFSWRRGLGWGGVYGWQGWDYGPAARRFGHRGGDFRFREGRPDGDFRDRRRGGTTFRR